MASQVTSTLYLFVLSIFVSLMLQNQPFVAADKALIDSTCKNTTYPDICISTLNSDPRSSDANLTSLARISVEITASKISEQLPGMQNLYQRPADSAAWADYVVCYQQYNNSLLDIKKIGLPSFDQQKYNISYEVIHNVRMNVTDCDELKRDKVAELNGFMIKFTTVVESILHQLF